MRVALLFTDGVGIGRPDPVHNPLTRGRYLLSQFDDGTGTELPGGSLHPVDASFGIDGRPQSATNQTAIFTTLPAPRLLGKHLLGFPNAFLRDLLLRHSIVKALTRAGKRSTFANAYPAGYLDALGLARRPAQKAEVELTAAARRRIRPSATTLAMAAGEVELRTFDDARAGVGLTHDIDGARAQARGFDLPHRTPEQAAGIFWLAAEGAHFALFEHYLADEAGHARDPVAADHALRTFDRFAREVIRLKPADAAVLVCSDHGNVEDLSTRSHTLNRVPVLVFGAPRLASEELATVADVGKVVLRLIGVENLAT